MFCASLIKPILIDSILLGLKKITTVHELTMQLGQAERTSIEEGGPARGCWAELGRHALLMAL